MDLQGLSVICNGLGIALDDDDGNRIGYRKHKYCLDNLKDLLRFLRRDDPQNRDVFKEVCKWNIVSKDLIPIIEHCQEDRSLVLNAVKVLVFLTMPVEPTSNDVLQQTEYLWELKSSITSSDIVAVIVSLLESPLENLESDVFTEDDWKLVQLVLTLFRNIVAIQDISLHQKSGGTASQFLSRRDGFLELLFRENVMDLVLVITQYIGDHRSYLSHDNLLLLEIFHYTFMGQEPLLIANAYSKRKGAKVEEDTIDSVNSLKSIMEEEKDKKRLKVSRHPNFGGTFIRLTMDGSKEVVKGRPSASNYTSHANQESKTMYNSYLRMISKYTAAGRFPSDPPKAELTDEEIVLGITTGSSTQRILVGIKTGQITRKMIRDIFVKDVEDMGWTLPKNSDDDHPRDKQLSGSKSISASGIGDDKETEVRALMPAFKLRNVTIFSRFQGKIVKTVPEFFPTPVPQVYKIS